MRSLVVLDQIIVPTIIGSYLAGASVFAFFVYSLSGVVHDHNAAVAAYYRNAVSAPLPSLSEPMKLPDWQIRDLLSAAGKTP